MFLVKSAFCSAQPVSYTHLQREKLARKELKKMGLLSRANHKPTEMSGGQQQRVGIARAFVAKPKVIFADEPTGNLDSTTSRQVLYSMLEMAKSYGITFVMVTHEKELAYCEMCIRDRGRAFLPGDGGRRGAYTGI